MWVKAAKHSEREVDLVSVDRKEQHRILEEIKDKESMTIPSTNKDPKLVGKKNKKRQLNIVAMLHKKASPQHKGWLVSRLYNWHNFRLFRFS